MLQIAGKKSSLHLCYTLCPWPMYFDCNTKSKTAAKMKTGRCAPVPPTIIDQCYLYEQKPYGWMNKDSNHSTYPCYSRMPHYWTFNHQNNKSEHLHLQKHVYLWSTYMSVINFAQMDEWTTPSATVHEKFAPHVPSSPIMIWKKEKKW